MFLDENGQAFCFLPGKTFIHIVAADTPLIIGIDPSESDATGGKPAVTP